MLEACWLWFVISKWYVELTRPNIESRDPIFFTGTRLRSRVSGNDRLFPRGSICGPNPEIPASPVIQLRPRPVEPWHGRWYKYEIFIASCADNIYDLENERWLLGDMIDHVGIYGSRVAEGLSASNVGLFKLISMMSIFHISCEKADR